MILCSVKREILYKNGTDGMQQEKKLCDCDKKCIFLHKEKIRQNDFPFHTISRPIYFSCHSHPAYYLQFIANHFEMVKSKINKKFI